MLWMCEPIFGTGKITVLSTTKVDINHAKGFFQGTGTMPTLQHWRKLGEEMLKNTLRHSPEPTGRP